MPSRPWPLILIALFQFLAPVLTVFVNAAIHHVSPSVILIWFWTQKNWLEIFEAFFLMPLGGIFVLMMRKWSYPLFLLCVAWLLVSNFIQWNTPGTMVSFPFMAGTSLAGFLLVTYFLLPAVRATYFDPSARWWESRPRFQLEIPLEILAGDRDVKAKVLNLSEGGTFFQCDDKLELGPTLKLKFLILGQKFEVAGKALHVREVPAYGSCYGVQFSHTRRTLRRFRALSAALTLLGFDDSRRRSQGVFREFGMWVRTLLTTGRGLTPSVRTQPTSPKRKR
jgi:hypothetical protein